MLGNHRQKRCSARRIVNWPSEARSIPPDAQHKAADPERAFSELAGGALRGPDDRIGALVTEAMPTFERIVHGVMRRFRATGCLTLDDFLDVRGETILQCLRVRTAYRGETTGELANWVKKIATGAAIRVAEDQQRRYRLKNFRPFEPLAALSNEVRQALRHCRERLRDEEPEWYAVLHCIHDLGMSEREVAAFLWGRESMHSTVGDYKRAAYQRLLQCLKQQGVDHA
jgi:hypothetical protein